MATQNNMQINFEKGDDKKEPKYNTIDIVTNVCTKSIKKEFTLSLVFKI